MAAHVLKNSLLQVTVLPEFGGKIASLRSVRTGEEFLLPPLQPCQKITAENRAVVDFSRGDLGGFDECLPSVAPCGSIGDESPIPDHGNLWRIPWAVEASSPQSITLAANTFSRPLRFRRTAELKDDSLILDYEIENLSKSPATWLWSAHPLLKVEQGDRIALPSDIHSLQVEYASKDFVAADRIAWPLAESTLGSTVDLSTVPSQDNTTAYKLFARMESSGTAMLYRARIQQGIAFHFDPAKLPYLGLWICAGAWPEASSVRQYTVAIEPATSPRDALSDAVADDSACVLEGGGRHNWRLTVQLIGAVAPSSFVP